MSDLKKRGDWTWNYMDHEWFKKKKGTELGITWTSEVFSQKTRIKDGLGLHNDFSDYHEYARL
jgi:hypothetical protein